MPKNSKLQNEKVNFILFLVKKARFETPYNVLVYMYLKF